MPPQDFLCDVTHVCVCFCEAPPLPDMCVFLSSQSCCLLWRRSCRRSGIRVSVSSSCQTAAACRGSPLCLTRSPRPQMSPCPQSYGPTSTSEARRSTSTHPEPQVGSANRTSVHRTVFVCDLYFWETGMKTNLGNWFKFLIFLQILVCRQVEKQSVLQVQVQRPAWKKSSRSYIFNFFWL